MPKKSKHVLECNFETLPKNRESIATGMKAATISADKCMRRCEQPSSDEEAGRMEVLELACELG